MRNKIKVSNSTYPGNANGAVNMNFSKEDSWLLYLGLCTVKIAPYQALKEGFIEGDIVSIRLDWIYDGSEESILWINITISANGKVIFGDSEDI
ncbi:MAG: hypothetical protein R2883_07925 [Caldisericia bacterium]